MKSPLQSMFLLLPGLSLLNYFVFLGSNDGSNDGHRNRVKHQQPHIIFIVMDDMGSHDLGMHGTGIHTPHCDRLAQDGIYLSNYYVLPTCSPTRAAIFSGKYPLHTGVHTVIHPNSTRGLPLDELTLPQILQTQAGYQTHAVGKWHLGHSQWTQTPTYRGFDSFFGYYLGGQDYYTHKQMGGYDLRHDARPNCGPGCSKLVDERGNYSTHVYTREAIKIVQNYDSSKGPLFLYLAFQAVHSPNEVPNCYKSIYMQNTTPPWSDPKRITYAGMLTAADEGIGNLTAALQQHGLWEDTLLVFTTDNGGPTGICAAQGSSNYPRRGGKCTVWEGGTTGDGFLSGPALKGRYQVETARRAEGIFHCVDWLPTLAEMAGVNGTAKPDLDGVSQLSTLQNRTSARSEIFVGYGFDQKDWYGPAIRVGQWKLIEGDGGPAKKEEIDVDNATKQEEERVALLSLLDAVQKAGELGPQGAATQSAKQRVERLQNDRGDQTADSTKEDSNIQENKRRFGCQPLARESSQHENRNGSLADCASISKELNLSNYKLYNMDFDREERFNVVEHFPEIVEELVIKLEEYKATYVPEPEEICVGEQHLVKTKFGNSWMPWCDGSHKLVVYS